MNRSNALFIVIMFVLFGLVSASLLWRYNAEIKQYNQFQDSLMQKQALISAAKVHDIVSSIRNRMIAISRDDLLLDDLNVFNADDSVQDHLFARLKLYFPEMYAFTLSDTFGEQIDGDVDMFIGDACLTDLDQMSSLLQSGADYFDYEPRVHAKDQAYHFDMMLPASIRGEQVIFFMSFKTNLLSEALSENLLSDNFSYLLRVDKPGLIEVSVDGNREQFQREVFLKPSEIDNIVSRELVPNTKWEVVVVRNPAVLNAYKAQRLNDALLLFTLFFILWIALFWFGMHQERKRGSQLEELNHLSLHDSLTGVANRRNLELAIQNALDNFADFNQISGLLYFDLNGFKQINDQSGHAAGDEVLKQFALRIKKMIRQQDLVARVGGDEFVVLLPDIGIDNKTAESVLNETCIRFNQKLASEYQINSQTLICPPSIGKILIAEAGLTVESILKHADHSMYEHKLQTRKAKAT